MKRYLHIIISLVLCISFCSTLVVYSSAAVKGDLDGDGRVTTVDARIILKIAAGQIAPTASQKTLADINGDGAITVSDVRDALYEAIGNYTDEEYTKILLDKGFPKSYVEDLLALYRKYPQWEFEPFITNLDWAQAVKGERNPHNKQLIEKSVSAVYKCDCSSCNGVIQESGTWVSASQTAVERYMDPRNWLNEKYIFQFEYNIYDIGQNTEVIESILKDTWMYNSYITYYDGLGNTKTFTLDGKKLKYSEAILKAAKDSGVSAYYLASKIVQEVGSTKSSSAAGSSGKEAPYNGIYNYYNIAANTGAGDGIRWANGYMKTTASAPMYKSADASSSKVVTVPSGVSLYYVGKSGGFYQVSATVGGTKYTGYVAAKNVSVSTSYGRPWSTPYQSIYYGAKYIYESFSTYQPTGYLQKFNVNPASGNLHFNEYMANVRAAAFESEHTYEAYVNCGILGTKKVFQIPVFKNMPYGDLFESERFTGYSPVISCDITTQSSVTLSWTSVEGAEGYQIFKYDKAEKKFTKIKNLTTTTYTDSSLTFGTTESYRVRAYKKGADGKWVYSANSKDFVATSAPAAPSTPVKVSVSDTGATIKWSALKGVTGYYVYRYDVASGSYEYVAATTSTQFTDKNLLTGTSYKYKIKAYYKTASMTAKSSYSGTLEIKTSGTAPTQIGTVNVSDWLNVRSEPSTSGSVVAQVKDGFKLYIIGTSGEWYKVTFTLDSKSYTGYVHSDYVTVKPIEQKETCPYSEPTATVRQGDTGNTVKWVQWYLYKLGYLKASDVDGDFGPTTLTAVKAFQSDKGLTVDGLVGSGTRGQLKTAYANK
ncbi:MAG: SH3 domain-containing protein [Clostridia bacterium]|nr:SH3 domain-containing protein [Clostridia bacterium]